MVSDPNVLNTYPDILSKEQFCKACHISKRTALYLLANDLIPHIDNGKKTRCYRIRKADIISFIKKQSTTKERQPPQRRGSNPKPIRDFSRSIKTILQLAEDPAAIREFYQKKMAGFPEVMVVSQVTEFIGYNRQTIGRWISCGKLRALKSMNQHMIPKTYLLDFLLTDTFNQIVRKTPEHEKMLWELRKKTGGQPSS